MADKHVYIVDIMREVVSKTATDYGSFVNYMYGHPLEVIQKLQDLTQSVTMKDKKFPLVALFTDIVESKGRSIGQYSNAELHLVVCTLTQPTYYSEDRTEKSFKPILHPISDLLIDNINRNSQIVYEAERRYSTIDRYYWGKQGLYGNTANVFNDYIDAVEILDFNVVIKKKNC